MRICVIAGFLGSGKTTLLLSLARKLTADGQTRVAIIENEAGEVGVDNQYLAGEDLELREIFGGCVCCSLGLNLLTTLKKLEEAMNPDVVFVEPSGVAGPGSLRQVLAGYEGGIEAIRVLVLYDAERFATLKRALYRYVENGVEAADVIVINKADLIGGETIAEMTEEFRQHRDDVEVLAISSKDADQVEPLARALFPEQMAAAPASATEALPTEAGQKHDHDHEHDHEHEHEPIAEARQVELTFPSPMPPNVLAEDIAQDLNELVRKIESHDGAVVGHVKCAVATDGEGMLLVRSTGTQRRPDVDLRITTPITTARLTVNAIVQDIPRVDLAGLVDEAVARMQG